MSANLIKRVIPVISQQPARLTLATMALITISIGSVFLVSDTPTGLFDDSAIYLIAAEIYSPYNEAASDAFFYSYSDYRHLPPGFPLLLALTGASQAYFQAHVLVLILLVLSLPVMYLLAYRIINHQWLSVLVVLMFLSTPGTWLESLKVSSENLYILISLIILYAADRREREITSIFVFTISLLLCLLILTRTVGWSLLLAFILNNKSYHPATWNSSTGKVIAMFSGFIPMYFWVYSSSSLSGSYSDTFLWLQSASNPFYTLLTILHINTNAFIEAWSQLTIIFRSTENYPGQFISYLLLLLSCIGFFTRRTYLDGRYLFIYLSIVMIWPYPDDMERFIYPLLPLMLIYSMLGLQSLIKQFSRAQSVAYLYALLYISVTIPSGAYIYQRFMTGKSVHGYSISYLPTLYYQHHAGLAFLTSVEAMHFMEFLPELTQHVKPTEHIISLKPELVTLYANRRATPLPPISSKYSAPEFIKKILAIDADYVLVSPIVFPSHPMGTDILPILIPYTQIVTQINSKITGEPTIILLKIADEYKAPAT